MKGREKEREERESEGSHLSQRCLSLDIRSPFLEVAPRVLRILRNLTAAPSGGGLHKERACLGNNSPQEQLSDCKCNSLFQISTQPYQAQVQYRMHPLIREWPSSQFYNGRLQDAFVIFRLSCLTRHRQLCQMSCCSTQCKTAPPC